MNKINIENKETPYSIHTFMWPFRWSCADMDEFGQKLVDNTKWKDTSFEIKRSKDYNEYVYFHSHVRNTLFANGVSNKDTVRYFEYQLDDNSTFEFEVLDRKNQPFVLHIGGVSMHLFFSGVGILTFQLENYQETDVENIQLINDFGRRTYPQFFGEEMSTSPTKDAFLPNWVKVSYLPDEKEDFSDYEKLRNTFENSIIQPPAYIRALFNPHFLFGDTNNEKITITHLTDDRMFTLCWWGNELLSNRLKSKLEDHQTYSYENSEGWYKLMFCDSKTLTCQSDLMLKDHIKQYTYDRWVNFGTLYGITRGCLFCLTDENFGRKYILPHMQSIYYQMTILCLAQRASIQKFSNDLSDINFSKLDSKSKDRALELQKQYLKFNNKLYFKEITDQIQGIEMYQKMQKAINIENVANQLDREIEELHNLINMEESLQQSKDANTLTKIATYAVPASLAMALFALFSGDIDLFGEVLWGKVYALGILVIASFIVLFSGKWITNKIIKRK